ncbi:MAG: bis(5'-nucleosyl)-tetraphosphatase (symmetrical) [Parasphingorhabdus sp.]
MAVYAVGDIQGCRESLFKLLEKIQFSPEKDQLFLVGDLINRGPDSLGTLRLIMQLGDSVRCVLGNHDLNTLAVSEGFRPIKPKDTIADVLNAPDSNDLLNWLRSQPLMINDNYAVLVHAGIYPGWSIEKAASLAREVEILLCGDNYRQLLSTMYGMLPNYWRDNLSGWGRTRFIINSFTRMRYIDASGHLDFEQNGSPGSQPVGLIPWFQHHLRQDYQKPIVFGHWSTLGLKKGGAVISLDSGCVWGQSLTAVRLDCLEPEFVSVSCA